ncbi:hypothetical protein niasHT_018240 [Heterodera trifolii]|uniref:Fido domain-containing protein n=1 Tax=Heterodera trifolii TaxID=157864 RepID=A0ABD2L6Q0_9BILA
MQSDDEAAGRDRQRAAAMRRWPSSLFLADTNFSTFANLQTQNGINLIEALRMLNHAILWDENQAEAGAIREHGRMYVGGFKVTPGTRIGGFEMVTGPMVRIHPFFDGNGRTALLFLNLILLRGMRCAPVTLEEGWRQEYYRCLRQRDLASFEAKIDALINQQGGNN